MLKQDKHVYVSEIVGKVLCTDTFLLEQKFFWRTQFGHIKDVVVVDAASAVALSLLLSVMIEHCP
jgi:hypothetical protein